MMASILRQFKWKLCTRLAIENVELRYASVVRDDNGKPAYSKVEAVDNTIEKLTRSPRRLGQWHWTVTLAFALGAISVALLIWTEQIRQRQRMHFAYHNGIEDFRVEAATSHLWLQEAIHGGTEADLKRALAELREAEKLAEMLIYGGLSEHGVMLQPLADPELRRRAEDLKQLVSELATVTQHPIRQPEFAGVPSIIVRTHHDIYKKMQLQAEELEEIIERHAHADDAKSASLVFWMLLCWSLLVILSSVAVFGSERIRKRLEKALQRTNDELEMRIAERISELEARTTDLRTANIALQKEVLERKEAEEALRESEERYRRLIETMNEGLMVVDDKGVLTYVNEKFCELLSYSREELLGRRYAEFLSEADKQITGETYGISRGTQDHDDARKLPHEVSFTNKNGEKVFTIVSPREIYDKDRNVVGCFAVITDITEKVALEAATMRTAHLVSLGEMAAGVAHEINNPINGIINYAWILRRKGEHEGQACEIPDAILKEARRIADIIRDLLLFARGGKKDKQRVHLSEILSDCLRLVESEMRYDGIQILTDVPVNLPEINADPREIHQIFMNMISNARYALNQKYPGPHEEKRLHIHTEQLAIDHSRYLRITFHDRGAGIPASIIDKITEPFFSTKPRGKGTGLGLSISDGIVRNHGGKLVIESVEGDFTNVEISLPVGESDSGQYSCN